MPSSWPESRAGFRFWLPGQGDFSIWPARNFCLARRLSFHLHLTLQRYEIFKVYASIYRFYFRFILSVKNVYFTTTLPRNYISKIEILEIENSIKLIIIYSIIYIIIKI